jgi:hypothetical protein
VRGLRTELDLRQDSTWGKQLASIRAEISNTLQSEIDSVPGRVRRILRQRSDKDILAGARVDNSDVDEVVSLISIMSSSPPRRWWNRCAPATREHALIGRCRPRRRSASARFCSAATTPR